MDAAEGDFTEAPSQMLQNWVWEEKVLRILGSHYKDGSKIPKNLLRNLIGSRRAFSGIGYLRDIHYATFDLTIHTRKTVDTIQLEQELTRNITGIEKINGTSNGARFTHIGKAPKCPVKEFQFFSFFQVHGYDAGYYGYLWSSVYAQDMYYTRFATEGIFNPKTGMDYRNTILKPGGSIDASVMLRNFLGREPTNDAFLRTLGLSEENTDVNKYK